MARQSKYLLIFLFAFTLTSCEWDLQKQHIKLLSQSVNNQCESLPQGDKQNCVTKITAIANYVSTPIVIDGIEEAAWTNSNNEYALTYKYDFTGSVTSPEDFCASFKVLWDEKNLYIFIKIKDDLEYDAPSSSLKNWYEFDSFEIYVNPDFSNDTPSYPNANYNGDAIQFHINRVFNDNVGVQIDVNNSSILTNGNQIKWKVQNTLDGWIGECSFEWSYLLPKDFGIHDIIGFEVEINDEDNALRSKLFWANDTNGDNAWHNTGCFGYLKLE